jgi:hypothetical protein
MRHPKTPIALRIKVGVITAPYVHPKKSNKPKASVVTADRYGFTVEPTFAWKLRNEVARLARMSRRRARHPEEYRREAPKLVERIRAKVATLECPCPSRYRPENAERNRERIAWLTSKRRSRARLTKAGERGACASQCAPCGLQDRTGGDRAPTPK